MLLRQGPGDIGVIVLGGFVHSDLNSSPYAERYPTAALDRGSWHAGPQDIVGPLFIYNTVSGVLGKVQWQQANWECPSATRPPDRKRTRWFSRRTTTSTSCAA